MQIRSYRCGFFPLIPLCLISSLLLGQPQTYFPPPESEGGWRKNTDPEFLRSLGLDPGRLEEFGRYNLSVPNSTWRPYADYKGILVIKDGWIIGEWYNVAAAESFRTYLSSNGKAVALMTFGILLEDSREGRVQADINADSPVYDHRWLPEGYPLSDPLKQWITFEQIFDHTSGLCPERTDSGEDVEQGRNQWADYVRWVTGHDEQWPQTGRVYFRPGQPEEYHGKSSWGEHFGAYSSVGFAHLGLVLENIYHESASKFLWSRLLAPLGFSGIDYHAPPAQEIEWFSAGGLRMTPRDYARFAYFLLQKGQWEEDQIVPESWVRKFTSSTKYPNIRSNLDGYFGEQYPQDMFRIAGSGINLAFMIPSLNLVALRTGRVDNARWDEVEQKFLETLFASVRREEELPVGQSKSKAGPLPGQIVVNPDHPQWLSYQDGKPFFMCGPGDPEGFLYRGILLPDGTRQGDQIPLIRKLDGTGANSIYLMAVRSHGGDGDESENPFFNHDPRQEINPKVLDQWEQWFSLMDEAGITIYFFFFDDGASLGRDQDSPGEKLANEQETKFVRELVHRFKHYRHLIWCIAEEYSEGFSQEQVQHLARVIRSADEHRHPIAVHQLSGTTFDFEDSPDIDQFAIQLGEADPESRPLDPRAVHQRVIEAWEAAAGRYSLNMSELAQHYDPSDPILTRQRSWAAAMGGAYVMVLGMDIETTPKAFLRDCGAMVEFFESTNYSSMSPHDELRQGGTEYLLADPGRGYIAYASDLNGEVGVRGLKAGKYDFRWYDIPRRLWSVQQGIDLAEGDQTWKTPREIGKELVVHIARRDESF